MKIVIKYLSAFKITPAMILICGLVISLISCNFNKLKTESKSKVIVNKVAGVNPHTTLKFISGPAFPGKTRVACCKGVPSRAKALAAIASE